MVVRISDKTQNYSKVTKLLVKPILITLVLNVPISMVVENMTGVAHIAKLPVNGAIFLIFIDLVLTILAGLIPSKIASKKDPVEALRSE